MPSRWTRRRKIMWARGRTNNTAAIIIKKTVVGVKNNIHCNKKKYKAS